MLNKSLIGIFFVTFIYLLAIFLKQPLEYVFNLQLLPLSLLSLILGMFFFNPPHSLTTYPFFGWAHRGPEFSSVVMILCFQVNLRSLNTFLMILWHQNTFPTPYGTSEIFFKSSNHVFWLLRAFRREKYSKIQAEIMIFVDFFKVVLGFI